MNVLNFDMLTHFHISVCSNTLCCFLYAQNTYKLYIYSVSLAIGMKCLAFKIDLVLMINPSPLLQLFAWITKLLIIYHIKY